MMHLFTYGYTGGSLQDLLRYAAEGALILDIRYSPGSRVPAWRKELLQAALGDRYEWCQALGNENYRGGPIKIANPQYGFRILRERLSTSYPVILLCACGDWHFCHRRTVTEMAVSSIPGVTVRHLSLGDSLDGTYSTPATLPADTIPAISLWQPWATLIAIGAKKIETRSWPTRHRGKIAIHAAAKWHDEGLECLRDTLFGHFLVPAGYKKGADLPLGAVVAVANLIDCRSTDDEDFGWPPAEGSTEDDFGDFGPGRYGWFLSDVRRIEPPIPAKGAQGIWRWDCSLWDGKDG